MAGADVPSRGPSLNLAATQIWMTPDATAAAGKDYTRDRGDPNKPRLSLGGQSKEWQTPNAGLHSTRLQVGQATRELLLVAQAEQWQSPQTSDANGPRQLTTERGTALTSETSAWPTPAARDERSPNLKSYKERGGGMKGEQLANFVEHSPSLRPVLSTLDGRELSPTDRTLRRRLNPAFGCWLMGLPSWWTNSGVTSCAQSEMAQYRRSLRRQLSHLLGE